KDTDWIEYRISLSSESEVAERIHSIAKWALSTHKLHVAKVRTHLGVYPYVKQVFELVNIAYAHLYGVVELDEAQIKRYVAKFLPLIKMDYACFVMDESERMVAFGVCAPSLEKAFKATRGRLLPTGMFRVLWAMDHNDTLDMFLIAVRPEYQGQGVNAIVMDKLLQSALRNGIQYAETGPMLECNDKIRAQWRHFDTEQHKRRRCYIKKL
ncbi:MAG: N-acetyltransferase, partial [Clostridia bacterium]|nr:N-acetyltransferase [Clostridia bacterium]